MSEICYDKIPAAIYADKERNQRFLMDRERAKWSETDVLDKVAFQGQISPTTNLNIVKMSKSMACPVGFSEKNYQLEECQPDNYEVGTQTGRTNCGGDSECATQETLVTKKDGSCRPEMCEIPYAQGHRVIEPFDWKGAFKSQTMCAEELYNHGGSQHLYDYNEAVKEHFSDWLTYNYQMNLLNELGLRAESNSSEGWSNNGSVASKYTWHGKPKGYLSISHLKQLRKVLHIRGGLNEGKLRLEGPMEDFIRAIQDYECNVLGKQFCDVSYNRVQYEDKEGMLRGREYIEYEGICYYRNEYPRKAIWIQKGKSASLKYIYPYVDSTEAAEVGLMKEDNDEYYGEYVYCDGSYHDLITIYDFIHPMSSKRWTLDKPINPESDNTSTGLELHVAKEWQIPCNINKDKWFYYSRPRMRHLVEYPEHLGFHLALSRDTGGGEIVVTTKTSRIPTDNTKCGIPTVPPKYDTCADDGSCAECDDTTTCEAVTASIVPCPNKELYYEGVFADGDTQEAAYRIELSAPACEDGTIDYAFVDGDAVFGTNYDVASGQTGTINVVAGDAEIVVPFTVLGVDPDADGDADPATISKVSGTLTLTGATGGVELATDCVESTFCIIDNSSECGSEECGADADCPNCTGTGSAVGGGTTNP